MSKHRGIIELKRPTILVNKHHMNLEEVVQKLVEMILARAGSPKEMDTCPIKYSINIPKSFVQVYNGFDRGHNG